MTRSIHDDHDLSRRLGWIIRATRLESGWSQRELAVRMQSSQSAIQRLEAGASTFVDARLVSAAFRLLGIRATFEANTIGLATRREQRDLVHAACVAYATRRLQRQDWEVRTEVEIGMGRYRGWIDLLAYRAADQRLLCGEIKTEIDDVGRIQRTVGWYAREAASAARRFGWRPGTTTAALLILCTADNDRSIGLNRGILRSTFPGSARALAAWAREPGLPPPASLALIDPRSRRVEWLRPTESEGRRSAAPYANYRAAAQAILGDVPPARNPRRGSDIESTRSATGEPASW